MKIFCLQITEFLRNYPAIDLFFNFYSYSQIQRALQNSNDPVLALGSNFSSSADSHLVAVQRDEDTPSRNPLNNSDYETQAINIANKSRKGILISVIINIANQFN